MSDSQQQSNNTTIQQNENNMQQSNNVQMNGLNNSNSQPGTPISSNSKQKLFKVKEGQILRYKKRLFSSNWRPAQLTLYSNGTFLISSKRISTLAMIRCEKNSTLIIFGQQLDFIPKRPIPPNFNKPEHMLAIGLINHAFTHQGRLKGTQIIFYWFSLSSHEELIGWVVAFQNSLYANTLQTVKTNPDIQTVTNNIALNNAANIANLDHTMNGSSKNPNDDISMSCLLANTALTNTTGIGPGTGLAAVGAAGLLAANAQYQALFDNRAIGSNTFLMDAMSGTGRGRLLNYSTSTNYMGDDGAQIIDPTNNSWFSSNGEGIWSNVINNNNNMQSDAVPIAEIATIMNSVDALNCSGMDCAVDAGGDCSWGGDSGMNDLSFAFL